MKTRTLVVGILAMAALGMSCNDAAPGSDGGSAGGTATAGGNGGTGGGTAQGGGTATGGGGQGGGQGLDACVPLTCATAQAACGMVPDGCGGTLDCGVCNCTASTFAADCATRPCEVATGCTNNTCVYEPVTCSFERCDACASGADAGCSDTARRACGTAACAANFCDPSPVFVGGVKTYRNQCIARGDVRCGTCGLGGLVCQPDAGASCESVDFPGLNPDLIECNGGSPAATVLYVDPASTAPGHTGAKEAPFLTLNDAFSAAGVRSSRAIIIGGSPTFTQQLVVANGVSILGGFTGHPTWARDLTRRPVFDVPVSALANGRLAGLVANGITVTTEIANIDIATRDIAASTTGPGASNVGAELINAGALTLRDVHFSVGAAQSGGGGAPGASVLTALPLSADGQPARFNNNASCINVVLQPAVGGAGISPTCDGVVDASGLGGNGATQTEPATSTEQYWIRGGNSAAGTLGGLASWANSMWIPGTGADGAPWAMATSGAPGNPSVVWTNGVAIASGAGGTGLRGAAGKGGGGGGSGLASEGWNQNTNQPFCRVGASGGAGGAGGCGGTGGTGGQPGGWSVGVTAFGSSAAVLRGISVQVGVGGAGGQGGTGGPGTGGAPGGTGGTQSLNLPAYTGSNGGRGGVGQQGGSGGTGANGQVRGVLCSPGSPVNVTGVTSSSSAAGFQSAEGC